MVLRACFFVGCLAALVGCAPLGGLDRDCLLDGGIEDCLPPPDANRDDQSTAPPDDDAGLPHDSAAFAACQMLVEDVCGTGEPPACQDAPACAAATLLQEHVPGECQAALSNGVTYPACRPGPCSLLVDRVCGGIGANAACREAPGCDPARVLQERSASSDAEERSAAEASCNAALEDDVVFAPCG